jgi:topoisomerase-4 subunit A
MKGHVEREVAAEAKYKEGDRGRFELRAETTDKLLIFATNGKFYTIGCRRPRLRRASPPLDRPRQRARHRHDDDLQARPEAPGRRP